MIFALLLLLSTGRARAVPVDGTLFLSGYYDCGKQGFFGIGGCHYSGIDGVGSPEVGHTFTKPSHVTFVQCTASYDAAVYPSCLTTFQVYRDLSATGQCTTWVNQACTYTPFLSTDFSTAQVLTVYTYPSIGPGVCPDDLMVGCEVKYTTP